MTSPTRARAAAPPAAVLWDMDGTLVDTEPYWMAAERDLVARFGGRWDEDDARSIIGFDLLDAAEELRSRGGVDLGAHEIVEELSADVLARVQHRAPWRPGARRLLAELRQHGVPCALVTMSWRPLADAIVDALDPGSFDVVVTGDAVGNGKPHPEPYLRAAAGLGIDPVDCVAIEDSPTGVASATAAGCVVVAVPNLVAIPEAPGRYVVESLKDLHPHDLGAMVAATPPPPTGDRRPAHGGNRRRATMVGAGAVAALVVGLVALAMRDDGADDDGDRDVTDAGAAAGADAGADAGAAADADADAEEVIPPREPGPLTLHTWTPYWAIDEAAPQLAERANLIHELSPMWFEATGVDAIDANASTPPGLATQFLEDARAREVPLVASILDVTAPGVMAGILADDEQRARHIDAIVEFADENDWDGIDLDYEQFAFADGRDSWAATRPNWVAFVTELAERLHDDDRTLTVSIPPVYDDGQTSSSGYWVYDYAAITPVVDYIRIMAYDYSNAGSDPGPVAPLDWVRRIVAGTTAAAGDPSKLILGVPLYGYNWPTSTVGQCPPGTPGAQSVSIRNLDELVERRGAEPVYDADAGEWSFSYELVTEGGGVSCTQQRQVHYVAADGVQQRLELAVEADLGGVALFAFGYDDAAVWGSVTTVAAELDPSAPEPTTAATPGSP